MTKPRLQPIDKLALILILTLSLTIGLFVWGSQACDTTDCFLSDGPQVKHFSWQGQQIGAKDTAFILTFDRPMKQESVEQNLDIIPPLSGKFSWAGKRLAYTLLAPAPYGEAYTVSLQGAREQLSAQQQPERLMQPFVGQFSTRDRAFAYIGSKGEEQGRLILYNLTQKAKKILTPPSLLVIDFQFYPGGNTILLSAASRSRKAETAQALKLYTVTTEPDARNHFNLKLVLDNKDYQNYGFDLSPDGTIVVQRINQRNPTDFGLWLLKPGKKPQPLGVAGGDFLIAPDSKTLAVAQGEGISLLSLQPGTEPLDFLPQFGKVLNFSPDGSAAAMVKFNTDNPELRYTRSLFYVNNQGVQKELLTTTGSILDCQFAPDATQLYCLLTELVEGEDYQEQPYFAKIDLKRDRVFPLLVLPHQQDIHISMAPDGLGVLFDSVVTDRELNATDSLRTDSGEAIVDGRLWLLILPPDSQSSSFQPQLEPLPLSGIHPQWLP